MKDRSKLTDEQAERRDPKRAELREATAQALAEEAKKPKQSQVPERRDPKNAKLRELHHQAKTTQNALNAERLRLGK